MSKSNAFNAVKHLLEEQTDFYKRMANEADTVENKEYYLTKAETYAQALREVLNIERVYFDSVSM